MTTLADRIAFLIQLDAAGAIDGFKRLGDTAERELTRATSEIDEFQQKAQQIGARAAAAGVVGVLAFGSLARSASDLGEAANQVGVTFGAARDTVEEFARTAATGSGLSERAALQAASAFGSLFRNIGLSEAAAADQSVTLARLAGDLASFANTSVDDAVQALRSGLVGESEPLRRFAVSLDEATLKQAALDAGLVRTTTGTLPQAIKTQAAYLAILEQTTRQQGDFGRTLAGSQANQERVLQAQIENLRARLGAGAQPVAIDVLSGANALVGGLNDIDPALSRLVGGLGATASIAAVAGGGLAFIAGKGTELARALRDGQGRLNGFGQAARGVAVVAGAYAGLQVAIAVADALTDSTERATRAIRVLGSESSDAAARVAAANDLIDAARFGVRDLGDVSDNVRDFFTSFDGWLSGDPADVEYLSEARARVEAFEEALAAGVPTARAFVDALAEQGVAVDDLNARIDDRKQADIDAAIATRSYNKELADAIALQEAAGGAAELAAGKVQTAADTLAEIGSLERAARAAFVGPAVEQAANALADATERQNRLLADAADAEAEVARLRGPERARAIAQAERAYADALRQSQRAAEDLADAEAEVQRLRDEAARGLTGDRLDLEVLEAERRLAEAQDRRGQARSTAEDLAARVDEQQAAIDLDAARRARDDYRATGETPALRDAIERRDDTAERAADARRSADEARQGIAEAARDIDEQAAAAEQRARDLAAQAAEAGAAVAKALADMEQASKPPLLRFNEALAEAQKEQKDVADAMLLLNTIVPQFGDRLAALGPEGADLATAALGLTNDELKALAANMAAVDEQRRKWEQEAADRALAEQDRQQAQRQTGAMPTAPQGRLGSDPAASRAAVSGAGAPGQIIIYVDGRPYDISDPAQAAAARQATDEYYRNKASRGRGG